MRSQFLSLFCWMMSSMFYSCLEISHYASDEISLLWCMLNSLTVTRRYRIQHIFETVVRCQEAKIWLGSMRLSSTPMSHWPSHQANRYIKVLAPIQYLCVQWHCGHDSGMGWGNNTHKTQDSQQVYKCPELACKVCKTQTISWMNNVSKRQFSCRHSMQICTFDGFQLQMPQSHD